MPPKPKTAAPRHGAQGTQAPPGAPDTPDTPNAGAHRATSLQALGAMRAELQRRQAVAARQAAERAAAAQKARAEQSLFARAVANVRPLPAHGRRPPAPPAIAAQPRQRQMDEQAVLREALSDDFDPATLLQVDERLSYLRPGVGADVAERLRHGHWTVQAHIDLHGMRSDEAREALGQFVRNAHKNGLRCLRVVHGKGLGSPGRVPVLKQKVQRWLAQKSEVIAFVQAKPLQGGAGAVLVLLAAAGKTGDKGGK